MAEAKTKKKAKAASAPAGAKVVATPSIVEVQAEAAPAADAISSETFDQGVNTMTDTVKNVAAEAAEKATEMLKGVQEKAKAAFEKSGEVAKDTLAFHKANAEALVESAKVVANGAQTAAQDGAALARKNWDNSVEHFKALAAVRSPGDFLKLQSDFVRTQFDAGVSEVSKASEFTVKLAGDVIAPLQNRYAVVAEGVKARFAA